jgi:hypothetical protein
MNQEIQKQLQQDERKKEPTVEPMSSNSRQHNDLALTPLSERWGEVEACFATK